MVREVTASTGDISTVAGTGTYGYSGDGGTATSAELSYPLGVAVDSSGIFIADESNYVIREVTGGDISTVAGNGYYSYSGDGGPATSAQFDGAYALGEDASGNLYFADTYNSAVREVNASTKNISTVVGNGTSAAACGSGAATSSQLGLSRWRGSRQLRRHLYRRYIPGRDL